MAIELSTYLKSPFLDQVQANLDELIQGQRFTHKNRTYLVKMIETTVGEREALVIIATSVDRVFGEIFYSNNTSEYIKNTIGHDCPPKLKTIIVVGKRSVTEEETTYTGAELSERQQVLVDLFKKEDLPHPAEGYSRNQKAFALFVSALFISATAYGANKVRKGDITLPTRKEIGDFLSKTKTNASDYLPQLRQKWMPQKGVKA